MDRDRLKELSEIYRSGLLEDTIPFWLNHAIDQEHGGFLIALDRDGSVLDTDKGMWQHGRFTWLLATLYHRVEKNPEWLELARSGIEFMQQHAFDGDGRMFFQTTRDGRPLRKRRYAYTEAFAAMAFSAYARASGDEAAADRAAALHRIFVQDAIEGQRGEPKVDAKTRPMKGLGPYMILINLSQTLRENLDLPEMNQWIDHAIDTIERDFVKHDLKAVMELVGSDGEVLDHFDGRMLNPGHAIEAAWFIMRESQHRDNDQRLLKLGTTMLDWMWDRGWDKDHGGLLYNVDMKGLPVQEYWHDMKFWWNHNEAIIATLFAYLLTDNWKYLQMHEEVHEWAYAHFPDREHGEWFGYLHRDGSLSVPLKGNMWKGPFHLPRMQLTCWELIQKMNEG